MGISQVINHRASVYAGGTSTLLKPVKLNWIYSLPVTAQIEGDTSGPGYTMVVFLINER